MSKSIFTGLFILISIISGSNAQTIELFIKPHAGVFVPASNPLQSYYDKSSIFNYGGEIYFLTGYSGFGAYLDYKKYSVDITDEDQTGSSSWQESSTIISLGLVKNIPVLLFNINLRLGVSAHSDDLALEEDKMRIGYSAGIELQREFSDRLGLSLELEYDHNNLSVSDYTTFAYSRHNRYLSGREFSTGGLFFSAGFYIKIL